MTEWNVGMLLGVSSAYWKGCAIQAAVRLQFFTCLEGGGGTAAAVAELSGTDVRATGMLLDAIAAMGLISKEGDEYSNSDFAGKHLVLGKKSYMGPLLSG